MSDFLLNIHIESPGTLHFGPHGPTPSREGHIWLDAIRPENPFQTAYGPAATKETLTSAKGELITNDGVAYAGTPYYTLTLRVTEQQLATLDEFVKNPRAFGFDIENYHALDNSCIDYVWKALEVMGINTSGFQGKLYPMDNIFDLSALRNPAFSDGGLVSISMNHGAEVSYYDLSGGANGGYNFYWHDMWWDSVNSTHLWTDDDPTLPKGIVIVEPMTPSVPLTADYNNADGTSYH